MSRPTMSIAPTIHFTFATSLILSERPHPVAIRGPLSAIQSRTQRSADERPALPVLLPEPPPRRALQAERVPPRSIAWRSPLSTASRVTPCGGGAIAAIRSKTRPRSSAEPRRSRCQSVNASRGRAVVSTTSSAAARPGSSARAEVEERERRAVPIRCILVARRSRATAGARGAHRMRGDERLARPRARTRPSRA